MKAYWSNEIEEYHGEKLVLSKAYSILSEAGINHISSNGEFENRLLMAVNKEAQAGLFERLKSFATEEQYADLKEDITLEHYFFGDDYCAQLQAGVLESKIDINGVVISSNMALVEKLLIEVEMSNPSIEPWNDEFISVLLDGIELELAEETLACKHLQH